MTEEITKIEDKESIELTKNAKGVYQWSVKLKGDKIDLFTLERLEKINEELNKKYGKETKSEDR